jgi:hypothetical protein
VAKRRRREEPIEADERIPSRPKYRTREHIARFLPGEERNLRRWCRRAMGAQTR